MSADTKVTDHPAKLPKDDSDHLDSYVDYIVRQGEAWRTDPPEAPPGFVRIPCDATPRHWPMYTVADSDFYDASCPSCEYEALTAIHAPYAHSRHGVWRRWKVTQWMLGRAYTLGLISGWGITWDGHCDGCATGPHFRGRRPYILGAQRDTWWCLIRGWHVRHEDGFGFCTRCFPAPPDADPAT
jgi:hypothetical protein